MHIMYMIAYIERLFFQAGFLAVSNDCVYQHVAALSAAARFQPLLVGWFACYHRSQAGSTGSSEAERNEGIKTGN